MKKIIFVLKITTISLIILGLVLILGSLFYLPKDLISAHIAGKTSLANAIGATGGVMVWFGIASLFLAFAVTLKSMKADIKNKIVYWVLITLMILLMTFPFTTGFAGIKAIEQAYNFSFLCGADNIGAAFDKATKLRGSGWIFAFVDCLFIYIAISGIPWIFKKS